MVRTRVIGILNFIVESIARQRPNVPAAGREIDRGEGEEEGATSGWGTQIWDNKIVQEAPEEKLKHLAVVVDSGHIKVELLTTHCFGLAWSHARFPLKRSPLKKWR